VTRRLALLAAVTLLLAACSDSGVGTSPTTGTEAAIGTTTTTPAPPGTTTGGSSGSTVGSSTESPTTEPLVAAAVTFTPFVDGFTKPVDVTFRDGDPTLYVVEQAGRIVTVRDGVVADVVLDISDAISTGNEQGLLGMAFHPNEPFAYVDYTNTSGDTVIAEFAMNADGSFDAASERLVLRVDQPYRNHNGGKVVFGPDGYLYIGLGDGGSGNDPQRYALDRGSLLGKILRIDPVRRSDGGAYTVPADNPFVDDAGAAPEIWSLGLRNPWRFDFDTETGDLWIADVGQNQWEEVDLATAAAGAGRGVNFGWSAFEGTHRLNTDQPEAGAQNPIWEYPHGDDGCSVSGGAVYRGGAIPSLVGWYVVADYCSGKVWALLAGADNTLSRIVPLGTVANPSAVVRGPDGELLVLSHGDGAIVAITPA
jgi:glucose/arabinose dehydrogenase